ncbi:hypothetical protein [Bradyrhizobium sp. AZCC 2230]|uniref:hypothetical protein n=1 Tax=Bradyrhizobium sp. AZCC 2230 TaxID=3117021 RepID=UPI002FEF5210
MAQKTSRIETVTVEGPSTLRIRWRGGRATDTINLAGRIASGGDTLAPLREPTMFARAHVASHSAAVAWDDDDLSINAMHLKVLANE